MLFLFNFAIIEVNQGGMIMQRYFARNLVDNKIELFDGDYHHIKNVMRGKVNDKIEVVYNNKVFICTIKKLAPLELEIVDTLEEQKELKVELTIAISLVQEQKFDLILQKLTELGVTKIIPLKTERSIVRLDNQKIVKKMLRWQTICKEASEQSKRTSIPKIEKILTIRDLPSIESDVKLLCSLNENTKSIGNYLDENIKKVLFVIGPEGGFSKEEELFLLNNGFNPVSLGTRVMRVETAAIYVSSIINYKYGG